MAQILQFHVFNGKCFESFIWFVRWRGDGEQGAASGEWRHAEFFIRCGMNDLRDLAALKAWRRVLAWSQERPGALESASGLFGLGGGDGQNE
jgi:hypothetical protein